jgi:hypothetical protein
MLLIFAFLCSITNYFKLQGTTVDHVMAEMVNYHPVTGGPGSVSGHLL